MSNLERKYRITEGEYNQLLMLQGGVCKICGVHPKSRRLAVDHDHRTGRIRGLLCHRCNRGLQWFSDRPERLRRAAYYIECSVLSVLRDTDAVRHRDAPPDVQLSRLHSEEEGAGQDREAEVK